MFYTLLLSLGLMNISCTKDDLTPPDIIKTDTTKTYKYLALGDSYTIGQSVEIESSFPYQLKAQLSKDSILLDGNPQIIAKTGWTCNDLTAAIANAKLTNGNYDLVTLLIGVNDQYQNINIHLYPDRFRSLAKTAIALAGTEKKVIILSIPDYSVTPFGQYPDPKKTAQELEAYNKINKSIAAELNIAYIDITDLSRKAKDDLRYLANDQLHPSAKMYGEWVEVMYETTKNILTK